MKSGISSLVNINFHLCYTTIKILQFMITVKVHGVFPSNYKESASSRTFQFHQVHVGDSEEVITPFMQVGTYPTRSFATLGPSELQPPFTGVYLLRYYVSVLPNSTGQVSIPIHLFSNQQRFVFLLNSCFFLFIKKNFGYPKTFTLFPEVTELICRVPSTYLS